MVSDANISEDGFATRWLVRSFPNDSIWEGSSVFVSLWANGKSVLEHDVSLVVREPGSSSSRPQY